MLASADRSATRDLNRTTFYVSNMAAQDVQMNSGVWNDLEQDLRNWVEDSRYDTLYVVTGVILPPKGQIEYTTDVDGKEVAIPEYMYKALLKQEKSNKKWHSIAFNMKNISSGTSYDKNIVSVAELEELTGFTFFPNLGAATEVKSQTSLSHWR